MMWQAFVYSYWDPELGRSLLPAAADDPAGFWIDITAYAAASGAVHGELVRLV